MSDGSGAGLPPNDPMVLAMGLMLTEVRQTRRALENIERAVTRGMPLSLMAGSGAAAAPLGAPPMFDGALKVYVVNVNDLVAEGGGPLEILGGVLGGVGRFLGGFVGGVAGATAAAVLLPFVVTDIAKIAASADSITRQLMTPGKPDDEKKATLVEQMTSLKDLLKELKELFILANDAPAEGGKGVAETLNPITQALLAATRVINGLVMLVPLVVGAVAWLFHHLGDFTKAIAETIAFAFRMILLLRAVILAVLLDTVALVVKLAEGVLPILSKGLVATLTAVFDLIKAITAALLDVLAAIGPKITEFANKLMDFLRDGVGGLLTAIGESVLMRFLVGFARMLPSLIGPMAAVAGISLSPKQAADLAAAQAEAGKLPSGFAATKITKIDFPDLGKIFDEKSRTAITDAITKGATDASAATTKAFDSARDTLVGAGKKIDETLTGAGAGLKKRLDDNVAEATRASGGLGLELKKLSVPSTATGPFADVANAYEKWFASGGLGRIMGDFGKHLKAEAEAQGGAGPLVAGAVAGAGLPSARTAEVVVDVERIVIELVPVTPGAGDPGSPGGFGASTVLPARPGRERTDRGAATIPEDLICR